MGHRAWGKKEVERFPKGTKHLFSPHGASKRGPDSVFIEVLMEKEFHFFVKKTKTKNPKTFLQGL